MDKCKRYKNLWLVICILLSALAVIGIPMIVFGFVYRGLWLIMGITGIVFVAHGFFGITFYWLWFAKAVQCYKVVVAIERDYIYTRAGIAERTGIPDNEVGALIRRVMEKDWVEGMLFNGEVLTVNTNIPANKARLRCTYCGTYYALKRDMVRCPSCGGPFEEEEIKD